MNDRTPAARRPALEPAEGPALPTVGDMLRLARGGWGVDLSLAHFQELGLRCPYSRTGATWATLAWHPLYRGQVQVVISGPGPDRESLIDVLGACAMILAHQRNARHQSRVNGQLARARAWRERQAARPGARDAELRAAPRRTSREPHPAAWDVRAFSG